MDKVLEIAQAECELLKAELIDIPAFKSYLVLQEIIKLQELKISVATKVDELMPKIKTHGSS